MADNLPLPLHVSDLPVGATFTHKGVEYRKVLNRYDRKDVIRIAALMAKINPEHPELYKLGGSGGGNALSVCAECPASSDNTQGPSCTDVYGRKRVPCTTPARTSGTLILTVNTAYELALAGCVSW